MNQVLAFYPILIDGTITTIILTILGAILALVIAFIVGLARISIFTSIRVLAIIYLEFFRGSSALVQMFFIYFVLPMWGIYFDALTAGVIACGCNVGAYGSEVVRGALKAIPKGQIEACKSLGIPNLIIYWKVLLPQAMARIILPMGNLMIDLLKGTSLLSAITVTDLAFAGRQLISSFGNPLLIFGLVLIIYLILALPLSLGSKFLYQRLYYWKLH